jgi:hypothetical protein
MAIALSGTSGLLQNYDYQVLTTGFTYTFTTANTLVINPAGTLATGTITMPASPLDGMTVTITSTKIITALTINGNTGQTINNAVTSLSAGQSASYIYRSASTAWFPFTSVGSGYVGPNSTQFALNATASRATTVMTVTAVTSGVIRVGDTITSQGVNNNGTGNLAYGTVVSFGTGTGGTGTYNMSASGTIASTVIFASASTFTIPAGITQMKVTVIGGGAQGTQSSGATGCGGGSAIKWLTGLTPGNTLAITVGIGGWNNGTATSVAGGTSSVASGTQTITTVSATGGNTSGGTGSGGDMNFTGGATSASVGGDAGPSNYSGMGGTSSGGLFGGGGGGTAIGAQGAVIFEY